MKRKSAESAAKLAESGAVSEILSTEDNSNGLSRRELFKRAGYGGAALALIPVLPEDAQAAPLAPPPIHAAAAPILSNGIGLQLPMWGDGAGWIQPEHYETIQSARRLYPKTIQSGDINGDGRDELMARGPAGIVANVYDPARGQWLPMPDGPAWSDAANWDAAYYFNTIQFADINGDKQAEAIGRGSSGIIGSYFNAAAQGWADITAGPEWSDANGWTSPVNYWTIQCADINGDGVAEVLACAGDGMDVWKFTADSGDPSQGAWTQLPTNSYFAAGPWSPQQNYLTLQCADIDGDGVWEVLGRASTGMAIWKFFPDANDPTKTTGNWQQLPNGPAWSDADNWTNFAYYSTIQCADIDGDGAAELLARDSSGIVTWKFLPDAGNPTGGTWQQLPDGPAWGDANNWGVQQYYATIQFGDIDGDGRAEILGRGADGVNVWKYNPTNQTTGNWTQLNTMTLWSDANGWNVVERYSTIQTARAILPGDVGYTGSGNHPQAVLTGRSALGMQTFRYDVPSGQWIQPSPAYPAWTESQQAAYALIGSVLFPSPFPSTNIRASYADATRVPQWWPQLYKPRAGDAYDMPPANRPACLVAPPSGVAQDDWNAVTWQIFWELYWVDQINQWFGENGIKSLLDEQGIGSTLQLTDIGSNYLSIADNSSLSILLSILAAIGSAFSAILSLGTDIPAAVAGIVSAAIGIAQASLPNQGNAYTQAYDQLQKDFDDSFTASLAGNAQTQFAITGGSDIRRNYVPGDFGLIRTFGELIQNGIWYLTPEALYEMLLAGQRGYAASIFQALLNAQPGTSGSPRKRATARRRSTTIPHRPPTSPPSPVRTPRQARSGFPPRTARGRTTNFRRSTRSTHFSTRQRTTPGIPSKSPSRTFSGLSGWPAWAWKDVNGEVQTAAPGKVSLRPDIRISVQLRRDPATGRIQVEATLINRGIDAATNTEITAAFLNMRRPSSIPKRHTRLETGKPYRVMVDFPALRGNALLKIQGRHRGGYFGASLRLKLPS